MNLPKLVFVCCIALISGAPVSADDFRTGADFDFADAGKDRDHSIEDRRRKRTRDAVEQEEDAREAADIARAQAKMRASLKDDTGALSSVKSSLFDSEADRYAVDLSDGIKRGGGVMHRGLPTGSLTDISEMSDGAFGDDDQKDLHTDRRHDATSDEPHRSVYTLLNSEDDLDSDDSKRAREWRYLIKPQNLIGDWVPGPADRQDNGGFVKEEDLGHVVPYTLNGHIKIQRPVPWAADN